MAGRGNSMAMEASAACTTRITADALAVVLLAVLSVLSPTQVKAESTRTLMVAVWLPHHTAAKRGMEDDHWMNGTMALLRMRHMVDKHTMGRCRPMKKIRTRSNSHTLDTSHFSQINPPMRVMQAMEAVINIRRAILADQDSPRKNVEVLLVVLRK
jgi:hypothetical protein